MVLSMFLYAGLFVVVMYIVPLKSLSVLCMSCHAPGVCGSDGMHATVAVPHWQSWHGQVQRAP